MAEDPGPGTLYGLTAILCINKTAEIECVVSVCFHTSFCPNSAVNGDRHSGVQRELKKPAGIPQKRRLRHTLVDSNCVPPGLLAPIGHSLHFCWLLVPYRVTPCSVQVPG